MKKEGGREYVAFILIGKLAIDFLSCSTDHQLHFYVVFCTRSSGERSNVIIVSKQSSYLYTVYAAYTITLWNKLFYFRNKILVTNTLSITW